MFVRLCVSALALSGLVACDSVNATLAGGLSQIGAPPDATGQGIRTLALLGGDVRVRGPEGYCVDQSASDARRGFAVMAGCAVLSADTPVMPSLNGLITVQFGDAGTASVTGNEDAFAAFLKSEAGRSVLATNGDMTTVVDVATIADRAGVLARFVDTSGPSIAGTSGPQWRGFLDINGRLATVTVLSLDYDDLTRGQGERLLIVAMADLAEVNAPASQAVTVAEASLE
ncbi:MAG: hypothetical protein ACSHWY_09480 [Octadecabacter sp.]